MNTSNLRNKEFEEEISKHKHFLDQYEKVTKETLAEMDTVHAPYWKARNDLARLLITVSSAIFALTVTFASSNLAKNTPFILLFFEWFLLILSISFCIGSLWFTMKIASVHIQFFNQRNAFLQKVEKMLEHGRFEKEFFEGLFSAPFKEVGGNDKKSWFLIRCGLISFIVSLLLLCAIGWTSFPSSNINPVSKKISSNLRIENSTQSFWS